MVYLFTIDIGKSWKKTEQRGSQAGNGLKMQSGRNWPNLAAIGFRAFLVMDWDDFVVPAERSSADGSQADKCRKRRPGRKWQAMT